MIRFIHNILSPGLSYQKYFFPFIFITAASVTLIAQNDNAAARPDRGITPSNSYSISNIENINLTNGNVNISIPLASLPPVRGGKLSWTVSAVYNSKLWDVKREERYEGQPPDQARFVKDIPQLSEYGGWRIGGSYELVFHESREDFDWIIVSGDPDEQYLSQYYNWYKVILNTPDGATHELRPVDYQPYSGAKENLHGYYKETPYNTGNAMRYYSYDGSFLWAVIYPSGSISWKIYQKDGTQVVKYSSGVLKVIDTNGNSLKIYTDSIGSTVTTHYQDEQTGREIKLVSVLGSNPQVQYQTVGGGWVSVDLVFGNTSVFGQVYEVTDYAGNGNTCSRKNLLDLAYLDVLREITLPQTESGQPRQKFNFSYNSDTTDSTSHIWYLDCTLNYPQYVTSASHGWGSLSQIVIPTGAEIDYSYYLDGVHEPGEANNIPRDRIYQKAVDHDGISNPETWNYTISLNTAAVTAPDGSVQTETAFSHDIGFGVPGLGGNDGLGGLVYRINRSDKVIIERHWTRLPFSGSSDISPGGKVVFNPVVDAEYTTLVENGVALKMSARTFQYDYNGNLIAESAYDWFDPASVSRDVHGVPTGVPGGLNPSSSTTASHYNQADTAFSGNVYAKRAIATGMPLILSALKETVNGSSTRQFSYDNQAYGTAPTIGNLTASSAWDNYGNQWLNTAHAYDAWGNRASTTDQNGNITKFFYEDATQANLTRMVKGPCAGNPDPCAHTTTMTYDYSTGALLTQTDPNGKTSTINYTNQLLNAPDPFLRPGIASGPAVTSVVNGVSYGNQQHQVRNFYYDNARRVVVESDLNTQGDRLVKSESRFDQLGRVWRKAGSAAGNGWSITDTLYDSMGRVWKVSDSYFATGVDGPVNPSGIWLETTYDLLGRIIDQKTPDTAKVLTAYHANQVLVTDQAGKQRMSENDGLGRLVKVWEIRSADPDTVSVSFPNHPSVTAGYLTTYDYDNLNNLIRVAQGSQRRWFAYDSLSRLIRARNPEQGTVSLTPPVSVTVGGETNAQWSIGYTYDANGNLKTRTDARSITATFNYDALNRTTSITYSSYPNGSAGSYFVYDNPDTAKIGKGRLWYNYNLTYGANGELKYSYNFIDAYDALGRPLTKTQKFLTRTCGICSYFTRDFTLNRAYNLAGAVTRQTYPSGHITTWNYDSAGRLNEFKGNLGGASPDVQYAADIRYNGRTQTIREQFGTTVPLYHRKHYKRGQLFDIRLGTSNDAGLDVEDPNVWQYANGSWNYGALRLFYSVSLNDYTSANPVQADNNGNVHRMDHFVPTALDGSGTIVSWAMSADSYVYDQLNRIVSVTETPTGGSGPGFIQQYIYDRFGNRRIDTAATSNVGGGVTDIDFQVNASNNRLLAPSDTGSPTDKMRYDAAGNLIWDEYSNPSNPARDFGYDAENRIGIAKNAAQSELARYIYDPDGRRVRRIVNGVETWLVYGMDGELIAEYAFNMDAPNPQKEYGYRGGQMLVVWDGTETGDRQLQWLVTDHLGSPRMVVDKGGGVRRRDFLPFGEELAANIGHRNAPGARYISDQVRQKFTGYERDSETGLDFSWVRYYGSVMGRFCSPDDFLNDSDLHDPQSLNKYAYVRNNPLKFIDPTGTKATVTVNYDSEKMTGTIVISASFAVYSPNGDISQADLQKQADLLKEQIEATYSGSFTEHGITFTVSADITAKAFSESEATKLGNEGMVDNLVAVLNESQISVIVPSETPGGKMIDNALGATYRVKGEKFDRMTIAGKSTDLEGLNLYSHEFGHSLGVNRHLERSDVMGSGGTKPTRISRADFTEIFGRGLGAHRYAHGCSCILPTTRSVLRSGAVYPGVLK